MITYQPVVSILLDAIANKATSESDSDNDIEMPLDHAEMRHQKVIIKFLELD